MVDSEYNFLIYDLIRKKIPVQIDYQDKYGKRCKTCSSIIMHYYKNDIEYIELEEGLKIATNDINEINGIDSGNHWC